MRRRFEIQPENHFDLNMDPRRTKDSIHSVPFYVGFIFLIILLGLFGAVFWIDKVLPTPLTILDEKTYPEAFITERAVNDLKTLTDFGPRVTGSYENEFLTVGFLTAELNTIHQNAHPNQTIEVDVQLVSGGYNLELLAVNKINIYANVQNVVVKLSGKNNSTTNSLLVNSHFDSVPTSPGGSDDGINVAAMLEILRKLSKSSTRLEHDVIFLFNGAEETPLQASHGFITQHKWAKNCKVVINLEACGAGGKIILFQSGPETSWLIKYYQKVPHPYGQAAGEEIFQSGVIPSDTDFRIFRDFGGLVGLDFAFFKEGYRYHTKYDDFAHIPLGSFQHVGDNTLSLVRNIANAPELSQPDPRTEGKAVYYDFLGWFMVSYTSMVGNIINVFTVLVSVGVAVYSFYSFNLGLTRTTFKYISYTLGAIVLGWLLSGLFITVLAVILDSAGKSMSWYANPWLLFGLYVVPTIGLSGVLLLFVSHELIYKEQPQADTYSTPDIDISQPQLSLNIKSQLQAHIVRLIWTAFLILGICFNLRTMYVLMIPVLFNSLGFIVIHLLRWQHTIRSWQIVYFVSLVIPTVFMIAQTNCLYSLFIPIMGRSGSDKNPDLILGLLTCLFTLYTLSPFIIFTNSLRQSRYYFGMLGLIFVVFFIIVFTPLGFQYTGDIDAPRPQRQWLVHTKREFYKENGQLDKTDAGIFFLNLDRNSPNILKPYVKELSTAKNVEEDCDKYLLCGLPLAHARMVQIVEYSTWVPASQPVISQPVILSVTSKTRLTPSVVRYNLTTSGPDRISIFFVPKNGSDFVEISLTNKIVHTKYLHNGRPLYFLMYTAGKNENLTFTLDIQVPENYKGEATMEVAITGRFVHEKTMGRTPFYEKFLKQFPDWTDVTAWVGTYSSYVV